VYVAGLNYQLMNGMFSGTVKEVLKEASVMYANTLYGIVEESDDQQGLSQIPARIMTQMMTFMMGRMPDE
jgi:hypothetical protein